VLSVQLGKNGVSGVLI